MVNLVMAKLIFNSTIREQSLAGHGPNTFTNKCLVKLAFIDENIQMSIIGYTNYR
jgi:hypothetical protein